MSPNARLATTGLCPLFSAVYISYPFIPGVILDRHAVHSGSRRDQLLKEQGNFFFKQDIDIFRFYMTSLTRDPLFGDQRSL